MIDLGPGLVQRLLEVREKIAGAAATSNRSIDDITLVAVSKTQSSEAVRLAFQSGVRSFGENYTSEFDEKAKALHDLGLLAWHFIGHLQTNKAKMVVGRCALIQSIDRSSLAIKLNKLAAEAGVVQKILIQPLLGGEPTKSGIPMDQVEALSTLVSSLPNLQLVGLMGIAPLHTPDASPIDPRPWFAQLRVQFDTLAEEHRQILSMGMSADFVSAIEEGSTMVRIGSAIFGTRELRTSINP